MSVPKISIIIPTHNRPELLICALDSVFAQTYSDYEVIVVDDGNAPRAEEVVQSYKKNGMQIQYIETAKNVGGSATRNMGIEAAQGEYIAFLDDDDAWLPLKLATQVALLEAQSSSVGFSFTAAEIVRDETRYATTVKDGVHDFRDQALTDFNGFLTVTLMIRRNVLHEVGGFDETLPSHQEPELIIRITQKGYLGLAINKPLTRVTMVSGRESIGSSFSRRIRGREMILTKHAVLYKGKRRALARSYFEIGIWCREARLWKDYRTYMLRAYRTYPRLRYLLHAIRAVLHTGGK